MHDPGEGKTVTMTLEGRRWLRQMLALCALLALPAPALAQACPALSDGAQRLDHSDSDLWEPQAHPVLAGGASDIAGCEGLTGFGFFATAPDFSLFYSGTGELSLEIRAHGAWDTALLVNDPAAAWHFNDDGDASFDPALWFDAAETGRYDIWVGTLDGALCEAELVLETFD